MRFDIIIPCYNKKPDIVLRCFKSIREAYDQYQGLLLLDLHVLIIDDASTEYSDELRESAIEALGGSGIEWRYSKNPKNLGCFLSRISGTHKALFGEDIVGGWLVHLDPDDTLLPNFFNALIPFIESKSSKYLSCIPIEAEVYSVKGDYWDNDDQSYMKDFDSLRAVAEAGNTVWNSVCDKIWNSQFFYSAIVSPIISKYTLLKPSLEHINYMEDFLFSMIYMQFECQMAYFPIRIERAYMDEEGSSCNDTELGDDAKQKIRDCMNHIRKAIESLIDAETLKIDTLTAVRYTRQMDRLITDYKLQ